ncbi:hypothetical protein KC926_01090 [Candidatus Kaiserbacteria bacterium]|nr:hypothetical protein [Candidatus Kaiserbacteria bacterium]
MKLFSKRNDRSQDRYPIQYRDRIGSSYGRRTEIISQKTRTRLVSLIRFLTSSDNFLEQYILIDNKKEKIHYFNLNLLDNFAEAELGYKFSAYFKFYPFLFRKTEIVPSRNSEGEDENYDDYVLFDLLETTILFSKSKQRKDVIQRINEILIEEKTGFCISKNLITREGGDDLKNISPQLKDIQLKSKIAAYFDFFEKDEFINAAKISADIINIVFSDEKSDKKVKIKDLTKEISSHVVNNKLEKTKRISEFENILNESLKISNTLNNQIYDIRHSEKDRISVTNDFLYKMICVNNIALIEFVLTSLKDKFIVSEDWESIKDSYIERYKINKSTYYYIPDKTKEDDEIDPDDIPF